MAKLTITNKTREKVLSILGIGNGIKPRGYWLNHAFYCNTFVSTIKDFTTQEILTSSTDGKDSRIELEWETKTEGGKLVLVTKNGTGNSPQLIYNVIPNMQGRGMAIGWDKSLNQSHQNQDGMLNCLWHTASVDPKDRQWIMLVNEIKITIQGDDEV